MQFWKKLVVLAVVTIALGNLIVYSYILARAASFQPELDPRERSQTSHRILRAGARQDRNTGIHTDESITGLIPGEAGDRSDQDAATTEDPDDEEFGEDVNDLEVGFWRQAQACKDSQATCTPWAQGGECLRNADFMFHACRHSCGVCNYYQPKLQARKMVQLSSGQLMPTVGFGTAGLGKGTFQAVLTAIQLGYRLIDSAQAREWYREDLVGQAVEASQVDRAELFLTSKLHPRDLWQAASKFEESLRDLKTEYLDLFLLHYPRCWAGLCGQESSLNSTWQAAWLQLEDLVRAGKIRSLGVSNFDLNDLAALLSVAKIKPSVVQVNSDPFNSNVPIQAFCRRADIQFQGYSTLGTQWGMKTPGKNPVMTDPTIAGIAEEKDCSSAQITLRWALQHSQAVVPRSSSAEHISQNLDVYDRCKLTDRNMQAIDALDGTMQA